MLMRFLILFLLVACAPALPAQYQKENLGPAVNSEYDELAPHISPDGKKLFFIRTNHPENTLYPQPGTQDIWLSKLDSTGKWSEARHLKAPFNDELYNGIEGFSADGNTRYIKGYYEKGVYEGMGFSSFVLTKDGWMGPTGIKVKGYESGIQPGHLSISSYLHPDNQTLLMSFVPNERKRTDHDLFVSFRKDNGNFTEPQLLPLSSPSDEIAPFLAADGITLYFASDRPGGYGKHDIWMSRRLDETWKNWSEPVNLGPEINTADWDAYYSVAASGDVAYMVSSGVGSYGKSDIVRITLKKEIQPNPVALVTGKVFDRETGKPIDATISYYNISNNQEAGTARTSPGNGGYSIILPYGKAYGFRAEAAGYYAVSENLDLDSLRHYEEVKRDLMLVPVKVGQVVRLNNIFFDFSKATLRPESFAELDRVVKLLNDNPTLEIDLAGHTDNVGSEEANRQLSEDRAKAVYSYLIEKGIPATRLSFAGFGESKPLVPNATEEERAQNRRVEFTIRKK